VFPQGVGLWRLPGALRLAARRLDMGIQAAKMAVGKDVPKHPRTGCWQVPEIARDEQHW